MQRYLRVSALLGIVLVGLSLWPQTALAQSYPWRPIRIVVGNTPGGHSDLLARLVGQNLAQLWGQPVAIENRAGASSTIGAEAVAHAPADGYTLLLAGQSNLVLAAVLGNNRRYDPVTDFAPIGRVAHVPLGLVVNSAVPASTFRELIALAKARPGRLTYGSVGSGAITSLAVELLKTSEELDILEVPYKGTAPALTDLLAGRIDMMICDLAIAAPHVKAGALRLMAATGRRRATNAPDLPTLAEQGVHGFAVEPWYGLVAPAKTPIDILAKLRIGLTQLRRMPEFQQRLEQLGYEPIEDSPQQFAADFASDIEKLSAIIKRAGLVREPQ